MTYIFRRRMITDRERRYNEALQELLSEFREIFQHPSYEGQAAWAEQMIKSIEHEMEEIEAGLARVPESWRG